jgi:DNA polymerase III subunit gamma/tau
MENFIVSARKYRPATFDTVVGQSAITGTLKNAIKTNHLAQAFLFCGPRGVGKTTCARILAKTINCHHISDVTEACNQCESCITFNESKSLNIYELDAASNNSVDDIRSLVEQVRFAPHLGKYKIYIIDEVHMLSVNAFNAFLKTLEEPPPYAIFILATTEKHKIIPTILSRCQIFDFNRIMISDIVTLLAQIAGKEKIEAEVEGLHVIAQKADGALRDALSMFDQIVSFSGNTITCKDVLENLNILDSDYYFAITDLLIQGSIPGSLVLFDEILSKGFDGHNFISGLSSHFRNLLVSKDKATIQLLQTSETVRNKFLIQTERLKQAHLFALLDIASQCDIEYKSAKNQRLHVELCLMRMCNLFIGSEAVSPVLRLESEKHDNEKKGDPEPATRQTEQKESKQPKESGSGAVQTDPVHITHQTKSLVSESPPKYLSTVSIKKQIIKTETQEPESIHASEPVYENKPINKADFEQAWKTFAEDLKTNGRMNLYTAMVTRPPEINDDNHILVKLDNGVQVNEFNAIRTELLGFLKKRLNNGLINITSDIFISDNPAKEKKFTNKEKFNQMAETNPNLKLLKNQLDLDINF